MESPISLVGFYHHALDLPVTLSYVFILQSITCLIIVMILSDGKVEATDTEKFKLLVKKLPPVYVDIINGLGKGRV